MLSTYSLPVTIAAALLASTILAGRSLAQSPDLVGWRSKLGFHAASAYSPASLAGSAAHSGFRQATDSRGGWEPGRVSYAQRLGSALAYSGIRNGLAFGLDSALHQDPRYHRSGGVGIWRRTMHAFRGTILTRTDSGAETFSTWRFGSAYGGALLSNQWYPGRINAVSRGMAQGSMQIGFDTLANLGAEFWPDVRKTILRRKK